MAYINKNNIAVNGNVLAMLLLDVVLLWLPLWNNNVLNNTCNGYPEQSDDVNDVNVLFAIHRLSTCRHYYQKTFRHIIGFYVDYKILKTTSKL